MDQRVREVASGAGEREARQWRECGILIGRPLLHLPKLISSSCTCFSLSLVVVHSSIILFVFNVSEGFRSRGLGQDVI